MLKRRKILSIVGIFTAIGITTLGAECAEAFTPSAPSIGITIGGANGGTGTELATDQILSPHLGRHYWVPVTLTLTNSDKYTVKVHANNENLTRSGSAENDPKITPVTTGHQTLATMENQWGYRVAPDVASISANPFADDESTLFSALGTEDQTIVDSAEAVPTKYLVFDFGANVNDEMPSGKYGTNVTITVVATPFSLVMQEMSSANCRNLADGDQMTTLDRRDNKQYLVKKLADGNCWMMQNLGLEGGQTVEAWDSASGETFAYAMPESAPAKELFYNTPFMIDGSFKNASYNTEGYISGGLTADNNNSGMYYSWHTAAAQEESTDNPEYKDYTTSICPKGWYLPTSVQFLALTTLYGVTGDTDTTHQSTTSFFAAWLPAGKFNRTSDLGDAPQNDSARWYSSTVTREKTALHLSMYPSRRVIPNNDSVTRNALFNVRCVLLSNPL